VVNAQERNSINREVLSKDEEAVAKIEDNSMKRYIENEITARNIETWRLNEKKVRTDMRAEYRRKMDQSVTTSRQMIEEEKDFRKFMLNEGNDSLSKKLSLCTSSKIEVPEDIHDRMRLARKLSQFEKAKEDAIVAYELEMSRRIGDYNASRKQAIKQAEDFGCGIALNPMRGEDYFRDDGSVTAYNQPVRISQDSAAQYFDSASTVTYPGKTRDSCYDSSCPPVYLDPNYDPNDAARSLTSQLYDPTTRTRKPKAKSVKNTEVADAMRRYDDDNFGDSVSNDMHDRSGRGGGENASDDVSITDSIDSNMCDDQASVLPPMSDTI
jgi:hypothetical protein